MIRPLLRRAGLVTARELQAVEEKLRAVRQRLDEATARVAAGRDDAGRYKARLAELESERDRQLARSGEAAAQASQRIAMLEQRLAGLEQKLKERELRADTAAQEEAALDARMAAAVQELEQARGDLAVVEVKLNILEGAANALDARLRTASRLPSVPGDER